MWTPFSHLRSVFGKRSPTVHELQAMKRRNLVDYRPTGIAGVVGPAVWALTEYGMAAKYDEDHTKHILVPHAETRW